MEVLVSRRGKRVIKRDNDRVTRTYYVGKTMKKGQEVDLDLLYEGDEHMPLDAMKEYETNADYDDWARAYVTRISQLFDL